ncbi:MAG TPA: hypothetical protein P5048_01805 [Chlamydiales bacterium]|nr:hypothetical protein [Chlamydiales bacterium]
MSLQNQLSNYLADCLNELKGYQQTPTIEVQNTILDLLKEMKRVALAIDEQVVELNENFSQSVLAFFEKIAHESSLKEVFHLAKLLQESLIAL